MQGLDQPRQSRRHTWIDPKSAGTNAICWQWRIDMPDEKMIIFTRTYDFLTWLLPFSENFPRSQRFVVTQRLQQAALNFQETIIEANALRGAMRDQKLRVADTELRKVRLYLRLCEKWKWYHKRSISSRFSNDSRDWKIAWRLVENSHARGASLVVKGSSKGTVFCAAGRSTIIVGTSAVRTATGTIRTTSTGTTGFVLSFLTSLFVAQDANLRTACRKCDLATAVSPRSSMMAGCSPG